jgi:hypothetical protein
MLFKDQIKNLTALYRKLSCVWIKTSDPKMSLKRVWMSEPAVENALQENGLTTSDAENSELPEDHLWMAT